MKLPTVFVCTLDFMLVIAQLWYPCDTVITHPSGGTVHEDH